MSEKPLSCAECDELLLDYFEGDLEAVRCVLVEAHAATCVRCQGLIRDVNGIRNAARDLPELAPSRDLWTGIESRIEPQVVPFAAHPRGMHVSHRIIGIAAAALIVISSSITYVVARSGQQGTLPARVAEQPRRAPVPVAGGESPPASAEVSPSSSFAPPTPESPPQSKRSSRPAAVVAVKTWPKSAAEAALAPELEQLQDVLQQRRNQLDPSTVKIVEDNLALIDAAVQQARAALQRDPASGFLTERLDNALQKKVQLLRTVALLPSRS